MTEPTTTDVNSSFDTGLDEAEKADEGSDLCLFLRFIFGGFITPPYPLAFRRRLEVKSLIAHLKKVCVCVCVCV